MVRNKQVTAGASMSTGSSIRYLEDLACLEACFRCVEDYPLAIVIFFCIDLIDEYYFFFII